MVVHGLAPLGCIPSQRVKSKTGQCLKRVNQWIQEFNSKAKKLVASLNTRLPNATLVFADTYPAVLGLISNPTAYGKPLLFSSIFLEQSQNIGKLFSRPMLQFVIAHQSMTNCDGFYPWFLPRVFSFPCKSSKLCTTYIPSSFQHYNSEKMDSTKQ